MLFSSMLFLWVFLPIVLIINYALSYVSKDDEKVLKHKNRFLLIASLVFYAWGGLYYALIMISSITLNFVGGRIIDRNEGRKAKNRAVLVTVIILNIGILFFFKYFNMLIIIIESVMGESGLRNILRSMLFMQGTGKLGFKEIVLPIGISFYTFQSMSYVIDVYRKQAPVQKNIFDFGLYVSLFPQLIAGPIVKYSDVAEDINHRKESMELFFSGQKRFCYGLGKKVILANTFAQLTDEIWALDSAQMGTVLAWVAVLSYTLQIYYDFSGYSDMAIGIGRMLGFRFKENFNYPYTSCSIQEFWRRWHISLSTWFKEYVYIPLGGNRRGNYRTYYNIFIVFLLTGIWHGANFTFITWGLYYAVIQIIERLFLGKLLEKNKLKFINWIYAMLVVMVGWVCFRADNIFQARDIIQHMFRYTSSQSTILSFLSMKVILAFIIGILFSGLIQRGLKRKYDQISGRTAVVVIDYTFQLMILVYAILVLVSGTYNPFIYFQF